MLLKNSYLWASLLSFVNLLSVIILLFSEDALQWLSFLCWKSLIKRYCWNIAHGQKQLFAYSDIPPSILNWFIIRILWVNVQQNKIGENGNGRKQLQHDINKHNKHPSFPNCNIENNEFVLLE